MQRIFRFFLIIGKTIMHSRLYVSLTEIPYLPSKRSEITGASLLEAGGKRGGGMSPNNLTKKVHVLN